MSFVMLLLGMVCLSVRLGSAEEPPTGQPLFRQYCASCHGLDGSGDGPLAGELVTEPADLTRITQRRDGTFPRELITRIVSGEADTRGHGTRIMPVWGERLQEDVIGSAAKDVVARGRIALLVDYLEALQPKQERRYDLLIVSLGDPR